MKRARFMFAFSVACLAWSAGLQQAAALPTFQVHIGDSVSGTIGPDEHTWFHTGTEFSLSVIGAYGAKDISIESVALLLSVPKGETGTVSITSAVDGNPTLVTVAGGVTSDPLNTVLGADIDVLTDVLGLDGYSTKDFLPEGANFNEHYPFQEGVSDFLIFSLGAFDNSETGLSDYNAEDGTITEAENSEGEQKDYLVSFSGFSQIHFDAYGAIMTEKGTEIRTTWDINPGSHDSTVAVPVPGASVLALLGFGGIACLKRRLAS
jgi:hypothetical protein